MFRLAPVVAFGLIVVSALCEARAEGERARALLAPPDVTRVPPDPLPDLPPIDLDAAAEGPSRASGIDAAWFGDADPADRVSSARRTSLRFGIRDFDSGARAVLATPSTAWGTPERRAEYAVALAPNLPAARAALARSIWLGGDDPVAAGLSALESLWRAPGHLEASLWLGGWVALWLSHALVFGGLLAIALAALFALRHAVHDLGDLLPVALPEVARAALAAALWLLPGLFGAQIAGLLLPLAFAAIASDRRGARLAVVAALAAIWVGIFPAARMAGNAFGVLALDPIAPAAISVLDGAPTAAELARLEARAADDPLAERALAAHARRHGRLAEADARYQRLLALAPDDTALANNAANVRLELGHFESAFALYEAALAHGDSATVYYNLGQAHARAFEVEELSAAFAKAQALDDALIEELSQSDGSRAEAITLDLPLSVGELWRRAVEREAGESYARELYAWLLPSALAAEPLQVAAGLAALALAALWVSARARTSRSCAHCGKRVCPRCDEVTQRSDTCASCMLVFQPAETMQRSLYAERIAELRRRSVRVAALSRVAACLVPGCAGSLVGTPMRGLLACLVFAGAAAGFAGTPVVDPLVMGDAASIAFALVTGIAVVAYLVLLSGALARLSRSRIT
jgi:tetratricopeptide (TPR) repeat protein